MGRPDGTPVPGAFGADLAPGAVSRLRPAETRSGATIRSARRDPAGVERRTAAAAAVFPVAQRRLEPDPDAPAVAFPPDGADVELLPEGLLVRVSGGKAPYTWLAHGVPVVVALGTREAMLASLGKGFVHPLGD